MDSISLLYDSALYLIASSAIYLLYLIWFHRDGSAIGTVPRPDLSQLPGGIPLFGNLFGVNKDDRPLESYFINRNIRKDKSKPLSISLPFMRTIDVTEPDSIEYIQKTNFKNYEKGALVQNIMRDILGEGIFAVDGDKWIKQRKSTSKIFSANSFRGIIATSVEKDLIKLRNIIASHAKKGEAFDLASLFFAFTLSSFTSLAFGHDVGSLDSDKPVPFAVAFDFAQSVMDSRSMNPFWPLMELFTVEGKKMRDSAKVIEKFAFEIIDSREEKLKLRRKGKSDVNDDDDGSEKDLLELYMSIRDEKGEGLSRSQLRDATVNLIIAGRDTTAQALAWTFFRLLANPSYLNDIRKEIDATERIDYDNFREQKFTLAAFHEGLRLHPSVPRNFWRAKEADQLPNGVMVQKGDRVIWNDWSLARDVNYWGKDAGEFKPERWIEKNDNSDGSEEETLKKESMWKFHVFNGGARLCLGQNLALYEATLVMSTILREFDLTFAPGYLENTEMVSLVAAGNFEKSPRYASSLTLPMREPFMVIAKSRA